MKAKILIQTIELTTLSELGWARLEDGRIKNENNEYENPNIM